MKPIESTISDFITAMRDENHGFTFGDPWRLDEHSVAAIIPIIRVTEKQRVYKLLVESEHVRVYDTGNISRLRVENNEDVAVYIRQGEIFKGVTQERATVHSVIIMPHTTEIVVVRCVHASRDIHEQVTMKSAGFVPQCVEEALLTSDQKDVWNTVYAHSISCDDSIRELHRHGFARNKEMNELIAVPHDDLTERHQKYGEILNEILQKVPHVHNQAGMVIIGRYGFDALEVFDVPDSWNVLRETIMKVCNITLSDFDDDGVFIYRPEKAVGIVLKILSADFEQQQVYAKGATSIVKLANDSLLGEATMMDGEVIHLRIFKRQTAPLKQR